MSKRLLKIDASMRKQGSHSRKLINNLIVHLGNKEIYTVKSRDLADGIALINEEWIAANFTPFDERSTKQHAALLQSDTLVSELQEADVIVIGLPIYNFSVPGAFKAWIDQVVRSKVTFRYGENGPEGLLENKRAFIIVTSGGTLLGSDIDFVSVYIRHILAFIGIKEVTIIDSSGIGMDEEKVLVETNRMIKTI